MAQWASLTISVPSSDEWRVLRAMDMAFLAAKREQMPNPQGEADPPKVSTRPLSPKLFDALVK